MGLERRIYLINHAKKEVILWGRGVGRGGQGGGGMAPHKIWTRGEKGPHFLALFGLSAINQYFLVTLFPHKVNLPAHSNFSIRSHTVITTYCSEKKINFGNFHGKFSADCALCS